MKTLIMVTVVSIVLVTAGCDKSDTESERISLFTADKKWSEAVANGDIEEILSFWADDAIVYFAGKPAVMGKAAIRRMVTENRATSGFSLVTRSGEAIVSEAGDMGYTLGTFDLSLNGPDGKLVSRAGNYVCIWQKQADGAWRCVLEMSNFRAVAEK